MNNKIGVIVSYCNVINAGKFKYRYTGQEYDDAVTSGAKVPKLHIVYDLKDRTKVYITDQDGNILHTYKKSQGGLIK